MMTSKVVGNKVSNKKGFIAPTLQERYVSAIVKTYNRRNMLAAALVAGDFQAIQDHTSWMLTSFESKLSAAIKVARSNRLKWRPDGLDCLEQAKQLNLFSPLAEKVQLHLRKKQSGKHRILYEFGFGHRTAQRVIQLVLSAGHQPKSFQFTHRGPQFAVREARALMEQGKLFFAHLDIQKFYPSFRIEKLVQDAALGGLVPNKVVASFVHARDLEFAIDAKSLTRFSYLSYGTLLGEARRGIPAGSSVSSLVGPMMVSRLALSSAITSCLINYEDDFLLLASSQHELEEMVQQTKSAIRKLPGGRFNVKVKSTGYLKNMSVCFLGHEIYMSSNSIKISVSPSNFENFYAKLNAFDSWIGDYAQRKGKPQAEERLRHCAKLNCYIESWHAAFHECGESAIHLLEMGKLAIEKELEVLGKNFEDLKSVQVHDSFSMSLHFEVSADGPISSAT